MSFTLPKLPYAKDALVPYISAETIEYHYGKHHQAYVDNLNKLIADTEFADKDLPEIIKTASGGMFNNAAQIWNHSFYWQCLKPQGGGELDTNPEFTEILTASFGSVARFKEEFTRVATTLFGSGWVWLVKDRNGNLAIVSTSNAATPMTAGQTALLTCDVWEHAYYIDYRNARAKYVEAFWNLVNWDFVHSNYIAAAI